MAAAVAIAITSAGVGSGGVPSPSAADSAPELATNTVAPARSRAAGVSQQKLEVRASRRRSPMKPATAAPGPTGGNEIGRGRRAAEQAPLFGTLSGCRFPAKSGIGNGGWRASVSGMVDDFPGVAFGIRAHCNVRRPVAYLVGSKEAERCRDQAGIGVDEGFERAVEIERRVGIPRQQVALVRRFADRTRGATGGRERSSEDPATPGRRSMRRQAGLCLRREQAFGETGATRRSLPGEQRQCGGLDRQHACDQHRLPGRTNRRHGPERSCLAPPLRPPEAIWCQVRPR